MATPFSWTLRSLAGDSDRRILLALGMAAILLGVWASWFVGIQLPVYAVSASARLTSGGEAHPVASPVEGRIVGLGLKLGELVPQGKVLAELEAIEVSGRLEEERARADGVRREIDAIIRSLSPAGAMQAVRPTPASPTLVRVESALGRRIRAPSAVTRVSSA